MTAFMAIQAVVGPHPGLDSLASRHHPETGGRSGLEALESADPIHHRVLLKKDLGTGNAGA
jgi:hypothetical protein